MCWCKHRVLVCTPPHFKMLCTFPGLEFQAVKDRRHRLSPPLSSCREHCFISSIPFFIKTHSNIISVTLKNGGNFVIASCSVAMVTSEVYTERRWPEHAQAVSRNSSRIMFVCTCRCAEMPVCQKKKKKKKNWRGEE